MDYKNLFISGVIWSFVQQFSIQLVSFIIQLVLVRFISPSDFGLIGMLAVFIGIGNALFDGGMTSSLIRENNTNDSDYSTIFYYNFICSICLYFLLYFLAPLIADFYNQQALVKIARVYGLIFIFSSIGAVQNTILIKKMEFRTLALISMPPLVVGGVTGVLLAINNFGVWALVYSMILTSFLNSIFLWIFSFWRPSLKFDKLKFRAHFNYGYKMTISSILDTIFNNIYQIFIGKLYNPSLVGYYTRANSLMMLPVGNISIVLNRVVFPLFSKIQDDIIALKSLYKKIMQIVFFLVAPISALMILLSRELVLLLFTEKWLPIIPIFQILCLSGLLYPLHLYNLMILQVKGKSTLFLKLEIFKKIFIILTIVISLKFGFFGILWGSVFASVIALFINTYYAGEYINYKMFDQLRDLFPIFISTLLMSIIVFFCQMFMGVFSIIIKILLSSLLGFISYLLITNILKIESSKDILIVIKNYGKRN